MSPGAAAARLLGVPVRRTAPLGGASRVDLDDGRRVVVKPGHGAGAVAAEAAGLRWLAVPGGPPVPEVLAADDAWLVTGFVTAGGAPPGAAAELGRRLAALHAAGAPAFGAPPPDGPVDAWIGRAPMRNVAGPGWPEWYAADRVLPYLRAARDAGTLTAAETAEIETVCDRLPALAGPGEPPARLHGDLWSGNVLWATDGAWLIDPAAHGGHRETDLAMLAVFGCPGLDELRSAYTEATPLADGWRERVPLHQLFPLLVHVVLFGRGYAGQAVAAARAALRAG
ncbi:fructosamine kinase family protein [Pseudonocardia bannensis]|uniref:fructosamine kinase family protein n=1 Tax=Pseudonocardia bannensis TaxID=630973 RepID=UPI003F68A86F